MSADAVYDDSDYFPAYVPELTASSFEVVLPDGRRIGRMSLDAELGPVARGFAYAWPFAEALEIAERFGGKLVAR